MTAAASSRWAGRAASPKPGSSGSGLFTQNAAGGYYELRGTLSGGESTCALPQGIDYYARFDVAYPLIAPYLAPTAAKPRPAPVVEFYNALQDQYFITVDPFEIAGRDNGVPAGLGAHRLPVPRLHRSGGRPGRRAAGVPALRAAAVRRHPLLLGVSAQECASMLAQAAQHWLLRERGRVLRPGAGRDRRRVPGRHAGGLSLPRRSASPPRRRYTAEVDLRDALLCDGGWTAEGSGQAPNRGGDVRAADRRRTAPAPAALNYQGLWWNAPAGSESGWGINFAHQGDTIFATWFTYDADGKPLWFAAALQRSAGERRIPATSSPRTGPPFNAVPFDPAQVVETAVGTMTRHVHRRRTPARSPTRSTALPQTQGDHAPGVREPGADVHAGAAQQNLALATNYQDLWWACAARLGVRLGHQFHAPGRHDLRHVVHLRRRRQAAVADRPR